MANIYTTFELSIYTRYKDMNGGAKCRKRCGLGRLGVTQGHRQYHWQCRHSVERYSILMQNYMRLFCTVFEI